MGGQHRHEILVLRPNLIEIAQLAAPFLLLFCVEQGAIIAEIGLLLLVGFESEFLTQDGLGTFFGGKKIGIEIDDGGGVDVVVVVFVVVLAGRSG